MWQKILNGVNIAAALLALVLEGLWILKIVKVRKQSRKKEA